MNTFDFDTPIDRRSTSSRKWNRYQGRDVIPLWVADMDFRCAPPIVEALHARVEHAIFGCTEPPTELAPTIAAALERDHGCRVRPAEGARLPIDLDGRRALVVAFKDLTMPFYGYSRPGAKISEGVRESFWLQGMMAGFPASYFCIKAFSETDLTEDLKKIDVPTLILHGDDDQIVPIADSALVSSKIVKNATRKVYKGAPHGLCTTHKHQVNEELLGFFKAYMIRASTGRCGTPVPVPCPCPYPFPYASPVVVIHSRFGIRR